MHNAKVTKLQSRDAEPSNRTEQRIARVQSHDGEQWWVSCDGGSLGCRQAASCLLRPEPADRVLLAVSGSEAWILAVLERASGACGLIETEGPMHLRSKSGTVKVEASHSLCLEGGDSVQVDSPRFKLRAGVAELVVARVGWVCDQLDASFGLARVAGRALERVVERFSSKAVVSTREVERIDSIRSGEIDYRAENNFVYRGRNLLGRAKDLAKMDADQIHMG